jgi:hypothetical protein
MPQITNYELISNIESESLPTVSPVTVGTPVADTDAVTKTYLETYVDENAGGGGGSSLNWHDGCSNTPIEEIEYNTIVRKFGDGLSQVLPASFIVPSSYTSGDQIQLRCLIYGENDASDLLLSAETTLIRTETDALNSTTNQHSSTNTTKTITTQYVPYSVDIDLTDASGEINGVAVSAGDILKIELSRGTDSDSDDLRFIPFATDIII